MEPSLHDRRGEFHLRRKAAGRFIAFCPSLGLTFNPAALIIE
jgi:hypothetical protein